MSSLRAVDLTEDEYLEQERKAGFKSEYYAGEAYAMAGATEAHVLIVSNVASELRMQLKGKPCRVYPLDMCVHVNESGLYTYPDVVIACGEIRFKDERRDTLLNPTVIIEVLSPSTEANDRGWKFEQYQKIESLQEYVLIAQDKPHIERYLRQSDGSWLFVRENDLGRSILLSSIQCHLALAEVYDKVEWDSIYETVEDEI